MKGHLSVRSNTVHMCEVGALSLNSKVMFTAPPTAQLWALPLFSGAAVGDRVRVVGGHLNLLTSGHVDRLGELKIYGVWIHLWAFQ